MQFCTEDLEMRKISHTIIQKKNNWNFLSLIISKRGKLKLNHGNKFDESGTNSIDMMLQETIFNDTLIATNVSKKIDACNILSFGDSKYYFLLRPRIGPMFCSHQPNYLL